MPRKLYFLAAFFLAAAFPSSAQNLVANASFESGVGSPTNWVFNDPAYCRWEAFGRTGDRCVSVTNYDAVCRGMQWRSASFAVQPGKPYLVNCWAVSSNAPEVARIVIGLATTANLGLNERYVYPPANWVSFPFVALSPRNQSSLILHLISCQGAGTTSFDDVEVMPVEPAHSLDSGRPLGIGECVSPGKYQFSTSLRDLGLGYSTPEPTLRDLGQGYYLGNYARPAYDCTAYFSPFYYWYMGAGTQFVYRHDLGGALFTNAVAKVVSYYAGGGALNIEFSGDGTNWLTGTNFAPGLIGYKTCTNVVVAPAALMPTTNLFVRARIDSGGLYYVSGYSFEADVPDNAATSTGNSLLFAQRVARQGVELVGLSNDVTQVVLSLANTNPAPRSFALNWNVLGPAGLRTWGLTNTVSAAATNQIALPFVGMSWGENTLNVQVVDLVSGITNFFGSAIFRENVIHDSSFGALLPGTNNCALWWCEGTYKVGRNRVLPVASNLNVSLAAARNEYEPFQLVLRPDVTLTNTTISITPFSALDTNNPVTIAATNVEFFVVEYVPVVQPTDPISVAGDYPDPLIPWTAPVTFAAGSNQPLWATVYVPRGTPAGQYQATVTIQSDAVTLQAQVGLRVFDFTLSEINHTKASINCNVVDYWHASANNDQRSAIYDLYMQNFRKHRVTALKPHNYAPLNWTQLTGSNGIYYQFNFTNFDAAIERYLGEFGFNSLRLDSEIVPGWLNGQPQFTQAYRDLYRRFISPVMAHLREKGWLRDTYCFWIDEPNDSLVTSTVIPGMQTIGDAAPGLRRFLTRETIPALYGLVDTWCPYASWLVMSQMPARQAYGEDFWWYVSGAPGYPYAMYYTDHPAVMPRLRFWQGERLGFEGEIYWNTVWWTTTGNLPISPYTNAMTRMFDGSIQGNGNGVLLYPPTKTPPVSLLIAPPVSSLRWEMIREGIEDREYFWLLDQYLQRREPLLGTNHPAVLQAVNARASALSIVLSRTYYDTDPQKIYSGRLAVAEAIEALDDGAPMITRDPLSQVVLAGSNVVLRAEAVGWPEPVYQWQHEGTNVPGATTAVLTLTNFNDSHLGGWCMVASNNVGVVASAVANLAGYWVSTPQIIAFSTGDNRRVGDRTVLEVTAVSALPMTYQWYLNGVLLANVTNNAWAITNLSADNAGVYTVTASNAAGVATSGPIVVSTMPAYTSQPPTFSGNWAGPDAGFQLQLPVDNRSRSVLASTDLLNWSTQFVVAPTGLPQFLNDFGATNYSYRFYRVRAE